MEGIKKTGHKKRFVPKNRIKPKTRSLLNLSNMFIKLNIPEYSISEVVGLVLDGGISRRKVGLRRKTASFWEEEEEGLFWEEEGRHRHEESGRCRWPCLGWGCGCYRWPGEKQGYSQEGGRSQEEEDLSSWVGEEGLFWEEPQEGLSLGEEGRDRHEESGSCRLPGEERGYWQEEGRSQEEEGL